MESSPLPPKLELFALQAALKDMDKGLPPPPKVQRFKDLAFVAIVGASSFFVFREFGSSNWFQTLFPFATFAFGIYFMHVFTKAQNAFRWPIIGQYVDKARVKARLRELGS